MKSEAEVSDCSYVLFVSVVPAMSFVFGSKIKNEDFSETWDQNKKNGRLPPASFAPSQFGTDAILKDENVFSSKTKHFLF